MKVIMVVEAAVSSPVYGHIEGAPYSQPFIYQSSTKAALKAGYKWKCLLKKSHKHHTEKSQDVQFVTKHV